MRSLIAALFLLALTACSTLETAADRARDFASQHPVVTAAAGVAVAAGGYALANQHQHHAPRPFPGCPEPQQVPTAVLLHPCGAP